MNQFRNITIKFSLFFIKVINEIVPKDQKRILFYSYVDYSDNCRSLYERLKLSDNYDGYRITWIVKEPSRFYNDNYATEFVKHKSLKSCIRFLRSKYIFRTHSLFGGIYSKNKQVMCLAWHGMPLKRIGVLNGERVKQNNYDFLNVTSPFFQKIMADSMNSKLERNIITGLPRNDDLFSSNEILKVLDLSSFSKVVIWMPTFRNSFSGVCNGIETTTGVPLFEKIQDFEVFNEMLSQFGIVLILKLHPWASNILENSLEFSHIRLIKDSEIPSQFTLYNLVGASDALLTDYSSIYIDYLLIDKPIGFVFDDMEEYKSGRGFNFDPVEEYLPGENITNIDQLFEFLDKVATDEDSYQGDREKVCKLFHTYRDGKSSERFLRAVGLL